MTQLVVNKRAELVVVQDGAEVTSVTIMAPRRGSPLRTTIVKSDEGTVFEVLQRAADGVAIDVDLDEQDWARLEEVGFLIPAEAMPGEVVFDCPLRDPCRELLPCAVRRATRPPRDALVVHPSCRLSHETGPPQEGWVPAPSAWRRRAARRGRQIVNAFDATKAWIRIDPAGVPMPLFLSVDEADRALVRRLSPGERLPADVDDETAAFLFDAGVLVDPAEEAAQRLAFDRARAQAVADFAQGRFTLLRRLVHPVMIAALRRYYRALVAEGYAGFDTTAGRNRYRMHNEPVARVLHGALTGLVSEIAGRPLKPSYVYFASYTDRAVLTPHVDRDQCPITVSLQIDYEPELDDVSPWPLCLHVPGPEGTRVMDAHLGLGDGFFFDGVRLVHHRPELPPEHTSTSLFMHYVPLEYEGKLD